MINVAATVISPIPYGYLIDKFKIYETSILTGYVDWRIHKNVDVWIKVDIQTPCDVFSGTSHYIY